MNKALMILQQHFHRITAEKHQNQVLVYLQQSFNQFILPERQAVFQTVAAFTILEVVLVQSCLWDRKQAML